MQVDRQERKKQYLAIKRYCYQQVLSSPVWQQRFRERKCNVCLEVFNGENIKEAHEWLTEPRINWQGVLDSRNDDNVRHFNVAVFVGDVLAGLAFGRVSKGKSVVRIDKLSRNPSCEPVKGLILPLAIDVAMTYAQALGASSLRYTDPVSRVIPELERIYGGTVHDAWGSCHCRYVSIPIVIS